MLHEASYQHWIGARTSIWRRRATIASNGLKGCLKSRWLRRVLVGCWGAALVQASVLFFIGQLLVPDSFVAQSQEHFSSPMQGILQGLVSWLKDHPEVSVRVTQDFLFYQLSGFLLLFTMLAIGLAIPHLITRDLSSKAIVIYSSKAISRWDYILGKLGTMLGLLSLTWLGPVCFAWLLGNLLAPHWNFFWHSRLALIHALGFAMCGAVVLSAMALGVSAISGREKVTVTAWLGLWLLGRVFTSVSREVLDSPALRWLQHLSTTFNLGEINSAIFRLRDDLKLAEDNIPMFGNLLRGVTRQTMATVENPEFWGGFVGLAVMASLAAIVVAWRVKPE